MRDAVRLAELWLDPATTFPAGATEVAAWSASEWVTASLPTWKRLCDPVAQRVSVAWVEALPEEVRAGAGPMLAMLGQMGGLAFGSQLGGGLGQLAAEVLSSTDVGVPVGPAGTAALLPENIEKFTAGLDRPASEVMIYLAAREAAHQRLFAHVGWLRERLLGTVEEYARGITVDTSRIEELARGIDPSNPGAIEEAMRSGMFEQQTTPAQKAALARLETLLALIEGWVDAVVADAVGDRLPGAAALRETLRRRRASGGPAEQTFATIVGLELRPRQLRNAAELWRRLGEQRGIAGRDALWAHPDLIPSADDLEDPAAFVSREELGDPIAELEKTMRAESAAEASKAEHRRPRVGVAEPESPDEPGSEGRGIGRVLRIADERHLRPGFRRRGAARRCVGVGVRRDVAVRAHQAQPGRGGQPLQVAHGALRARVAADPGPERLVVAGFEQVRQLVDEHVVDDPGRRVAQALADPDRAVGRGARRPAGAHRAAPTGRWWARRGPPGSDARARRCGGAARRRPCVRASGDGPRCVRAGAPSRPPSASPPTRSSSRG